MAKMPAGCLRTDRDPWGDDALVDPYPVYRAMRDLGPVLWLDRHSVAVLPRYAEVRNALIDWQTFSSAQGACIDHGQATEMGESILTSDPPIHTTYRKPLADQLSVAALADDVPTVEAVAEQLAEALVARVTAKPVTIGGVELPAGVRVGVMFGSANRDERKYPDPDRFDVTRNPTSHLAFGRGVHLCVGLNLARLEAHSLLTSLARRVVRFELAGEPVWKVNNTLHGLTSLPIRAVTAKRSSRKSVGYGMVTPVSTTGL